MSEVLFSSWGDRITDNRNPAKQGAGADPQVALPEKFNQDAAIKAFIGWDGIVLRSDDVNIVDLCRAYMAAVRDQSCGKCIPCREGTRRMLETLEAITRGRKQEEGVEALERFQSVIALTELAETIRDTSLCGLGQTAPSPVLSTLQYFRSEYEDLIVSEEVSHA